MRLFWGLILIFIGIYLLGTNLNWWTNLDFSLIWQFWPLLLILFGTSILLRHFKQGRLILLLVIIIFSALIYNIAYSNHPIFKIHLKEANLTKTTPFSANLSNNISSGIIDIKTGAISLTLQSGTSKFLEGTLESSFLKPNLEIKNSPDISEAILQTTNDILPNLNNKNILKIKLTDKIPLTLSLDSGASSLNLDFTNLKITNSTIRTGASSIDLKIGPDVANKANFWLDAGASSININVPQTVGVRINSNSSLSSRNFTGFTSTDQTNFYSQNYATRPTQITIYINAGISSISVSSN